MRITGGDLAGRRIAAPRGRDVRPTSDRVRESLFAMLGPLDGADVLDLYAGSGAMGLEALSRGAARAVFVERSPATASQLVRNLETLGVVDRARSLRGDAVATIRRLGRDGARFSLVLMDPPYGPDAAAPGLAALAEAALVAPGGVLVVEASRRHPPGEASGFRCEGERVYGDTLVVRYTPDSSAAIAGTADRQNRGMNRGGRGDR